MGVRFSSLAPFEINWLLNQFFYVIIFIDDFMKYEHIIKYLVDNYENKKEYTFYEFK